MAVAEIRCSTSPHSSPVREPRDGPPEVVGRVSDAELRWLCANCIANVSASKEDFGLTTIEAAAFGKPTIALRYGGFLDTVVEGVTGLLFDDPTPESIGDAVRDGDSTWWDGDRIIDHAASFSREGFRRRMRQIVTEEFALSK